MDLPAELRNKIYEYALHDPHGHYIIAERRSNRRVGSRVALNTFKGTSQGRNDKWRRRQTLFANLSDQEIQEGWWVTYSVLSAKTNCEQEESNAASCTTSTQ